MRNTMVSLALVRSTLRVELDSGHHLDLKVSGAGDDWFTGEKTGGIDEDSAAVVLFQSICAMRSDSFGNLDETALAKINADPPKPLGSMLANLASLRKRVSVYGPSHRWNGTVIAGFADYALIRPNGAEDVAVPYSALSWIAVY
jgi:hypothetical protein